MAIAGQSEQEKDFQDIQSSFQLQAFHNKAENSIKTWAI